MKCLIYSTIEWHILLIKVFSFNIFYSHNFFKNIFKIIKLSCEGNKCTIDMKNLFCGIHLEPEKHVNTSRQTKLIPGKRIKAVFDLL